MLSRVLALVRARAVGAVAAQVWQAVGSFGLQLCAAWLLGSAGLGRFSLCFGVMVLATAMAGGLIGDSLVVLDRHDPRIRGGLQLWVLALGSASLVVTILGFSLTGALDRTEAVLMGLALVAFQVEELARRSLTACMRFWHLVVLDTAAVLVTLGIVLVDTVLASVSLAVFFLAILAGQAVGIVVGVALLPREERYLVSMRGAGVRVVGAFGALRSAQVSIPPLVLTLMRVAVTAAAGSALLGGIELARIYVAPVLLCVQGLGSYLLTTYVRDRELPLVQVQRRATRTALLMVSAALMAGLALALLGPALATDISGPRVAVERSVVLGWVLYVMASASNQPFASLAATRGRQVQVLVCRCVDAALALLVLCVLLATGAPSALTPYVLAIGLFCGGVLVRQFALKPLHRRPRLATTAAAHLGRLPDPFPFYPVDKARARRGS